MTRKNFKTLFLFSGATNRRRALEEIARGENADTALRGMNHIKGAEFIDVEESVRSTVPDWLYKRLPWQARSIVLLQRIRTYDAVIAQDDLLLGYLASLLSRFSRKKTRWYYIAINSSVLIHRHKKHPVRLWLLKTFWKSFSKIICLSHAQLEDFAKLGIARDKLVFVPFGVDADFYASVGATHDEGIIVSVGRDLGRDYPTLLAAAQLSKHPFVIVAAHKNLPDDTPLPENVTVHYNLPAREVRALYERARLVVIASKEGSVPEGSDCSGQTVILDALAAGRPVIATDRAWIHDYFTIGKEILTVSPGKPGELARAIERVWRDDALRARIARAGQEKVQGNYTTRAFARSLAMLIEQ